MPIRVNFPVTGPFSTVDLADIIDFIAFEAMITSLSTSSFSGSGLYNGAPASYTATGSGFSTGLLGGETYVLTGTLQNITFNTGTTSVTVSTMNISMPSLSNFLFFEDSGMDPLALENFLMGQGWVINMGNGDDMAPIGTTIGDGADFNLRYNDILRGRGGDDVLFSGDGNDLIDGGKGSDDLSGGDGRDRLFGGNGQDILKGGAGADKLFGELGADRLFGGGGRDILNGGEGNDVLVGANGSDVFVFEDDSGRDRVSGFDALDSNEKIDLSAVSEIVDFTDLMDNHIRQLGRKVVIDDGADVQINLLNTRLADLDASDFIFV